MKPLLGHTVTQEELGKITFPVLASKKYDGVRMYSWNGRFYTRTKVLRNFVMCNRLSHLLPYNLDGEIIGFVSQQDTSGIVRSHNRPDKFIWMIFDVIMPGIPFSERVQWLQERRGQIEGQFTRLVNHELIDNADQLFDMYSLAVDEAYPSGEGLIFRSPSSFYKFNRSTFQEAAMLKLKTYELLESKVVAIEPLVQGNIVQEKVGVLILEDGTRVSSGLTDAQRRALWSYTPIGKQVRYKRMKETNLDNSREPTFMQFLV